MTALDPIKQAAAAKTLRESLMAMGEQDEDLLLDMVEGETEFMEAVDRILTRIGEDQAMVVGTDKAISDLQARRDQDRDYLRALLVDLQQSRLAA